MLPFYRNQNLRDSISEAIWTWQSYPLHVFCWFQRNKDDITIVAQHVRDLFTTVDWYSKSARSKQSGREREPVNYNRGKAAVTEERLERIGYLEPWIFEYEFRDIFS